MNEEQDEKPFQHLTLLRRITNISEAWGVAVETSLFQSTVTGHYMLEQVQHGRHETTVNSISLGPELIAELLPLLRAIVEENEG